MATQDPIVATHGWSNSPYADAIPVHPESDGVDSEDTQWRRCEACNKVFSAKRSYTRHLNTDAHRKAVGQPSVHTYECPECGIGFTREWDRKRHVERRQCRGPERKAGQVVPCKRERDDEKSSAVETVYQKPRTDSMITDAEKGAWRQVQTYVLPPAHIDQFEPEVERCLSSLGNDQTQSRVVIDDMDVNMDLHPVEWTPVTDYLAATHPLPSIGEDTPALSDTTDTLHTQTSARTPHRNSSDSRSVRSMSSMSSLKRILSFRFRPGTSDQAWRAPSPKANGNVSANRCPLCRQRYEDDDRALQIHLQRHVQDLNKAPKMEYVCSECEVGFVHEKDLCHHRRSAEKGDCGFQFQHARPCAGHHPVQANAVISADNDHSRFEYSVRDWEHSQLQTTINSTKKLQKLNELTRRYSQNSLPETRWLMRRRNSEATLEGTMRSWRSEPYDIEVEDTSVPDIEARLARLNIGASATLRRANRRWRSQQGREEQDRDLFSSIKADNVSEVLKLIEQGADVNADGNRLPYKAFKAFTPLTLAANKGHHDIVKLLLRCEAHINAVDGDGQTALQRVASHGHYEIAQTLLKAGAQMFTRDKHLEPATHHAVEHGHLDVLCLLLPAFSEQDMEDYGTLLLQLAVRHNFDAVADALIKHGASASATLSQSEVSLYNDGKVALLRQIGYDVAPTRELNLSFKSPKGRRLTFVSTDPAIYIAAGLGYEATTDVLLRAGVAVLSSGQRGNALGAAIAHGHTKVVAKLLSATKDVHLRDCWDGQDAHTLAASLQAGEIVEMLKMHCTPACGSAYPEGDNILMKITGPMSLPGLSGLKTVLDLGANIDAKDDQGRTVLCRAIQWKGLADVERLVSNGADVNLTNVDQRSALHLAAESAQDVCIVELLIKHGADLEARDASGRTPLALAACRHSTSLGYAREQYRSVVKTLLARGAKLGNVPNSIIG